MLVRQLLLCNLWSADLHHDIYLKEIISLPFTFLSQDRRLYWCDAGLNRIETVDLDGNNRIKLFEYHQINIHPFDLSISGTDLYWSDWAFYTLVRMDKYAGSNAELVGPPVLQQAGGLHIGRI